MANLDIKNLLKVVDKRRGRGTTVDPIADIHKYDDVTSLRAALTAVSATTYSPSRLDKMSINDMTYAVRLNNDLAGI